MMGSFPDIFMSIYWENSGPREAYIDILFDILLYDTKHF